MAYTLDQQECERLWSLFGPLWNDTNQDDLFELDQTPLLAHYTSLEVLESMLKNDEVWFSNPLYMNDIEELRFGMLEGTSVFSTNKSIVKALKTPERHELFIDSLDQHLLNYDDKHLLDTYIFCLSEHHTGDLDGRLSMWRGYGGNGSGAALVFDLSKLIETPNSPLIISKVRYASKAERFEWFNKTAELFASLIEKNDIHSETIGYVTGALFERLKQFSLFSKHDGFSEEQEWRVVYFSDRDHQNKLERMLHYFNGPNGVEPKLKLKLSHVEGIMPQNLNFNNFISSIILGPCTSSPMAVRSVQRMMEKLDKPDLSSKIIGSSIPYRPDRKPETSS